MIDLRDRLEQLAERGTPTEPSIFVERIRRGLQQPQVSGGRGSQGCPFRTALVAGVGVVLVALSAVWLVGRDGSDRSATSGTEWQVLFCRTVTTAVPEDFVGSDEHIAQLDRLIKDAPSAIAPDLQVVRDYIDEHVDPSRPTSNETSRWPPRVQTANEQIMRLAESQCGPRDGTTWITEGEIDGRRWKLTTSRTNEGPVTVRFESGSTSGGIGPGTPGKLVAVAVSGRGDPARFLFGMTPPDAASARLSLPDGSTKTIDVFGDGTSIGARLFVTDVDLGLAGHATIESINADGQVTETLTVPFLRTE